MTAWQEMWKQKLLPPDEIEQRVSALKATGQTIATLNGSFDLLHAGHLHILYEASKVADLLIVALNSDRSIQSYKGPNRPIITLPYRLEMIAAIEWVDYVTWFDESDPRQLLAKIRPNVHVNGVEYGSECIEAATVRSFGGEVHLVDRIFGLSTSEIVGKIATSEYSVSR